MPDENDKATPDEQLLSREQVYQVLNSATRHLRADIEAVKFRDNAKLHLVVIPDSGAPSTHEFAELQELLTYIRGMDPHCEISVFRGYHWEVSLDAPKRLIDETGKEHDIYARPRRTGRTGRLDSAVIDLEQASKPTEKQEGDTDG